ncbi:ECF transporter S component [Mycobacterium sp. E2462]|uniref:ECF transporter S component n=1 Tax=Mycobacterium sp. E2462 TaxID=1834133 RepID=UPI0009EF201D|nr:ECF transporter S component [Mycobacterium sp. E2462]
MLTNPWTVNTRAVVPGSVGAALCGGLGMFSAIVPYAAATAIQLALAIIPFVGIRFGAAAGFFAGTAGYAVLDRLDGVALFGSWNWCLANGFIGLLAGVLSYYLIDPDGPSSGRVARVAAIATVSELLGLTFTATDVLMGTTFSYWLAIAYVPTALTTAAAVLLLVPVLDQVWQSRAEPPSHP